jgi:hypothetical protein
MSSGSAAPRWDRTLAGAILLAALGVLTGSLTAQGDGGRRVASGDCVTVNRPKLDVKYAFRFTDAAGTVSTSTTEYLAASDTSVRLRQTHSGAFGTVETVNESTLRVEDDLVVIEKMVSSGTNARGAFENTVTFRPARIGDPASRVCSGRTWMIPPVAVSTVGSQGGSSDMTTDPGSGRVISVSESVRVPAGTFQTVHYEKIFDGAHGHVVETAWLSIADGVSVKYTHDGPAGVATQVLTGTH